MLIRACSRTVHDCSKLFSGNISRVKNGELLIVVYFTRLRLSLLVFRHDYICAFLIVRKSYQL